MINISEKSTIELKALVYDISNELQALNAAIKTINEEIERRQKDAPSASVAAPPLVEQAETVIKPPRKK